MAGVTAVGVHPTHRRQGFLRQLMTAMHEDARARGEAIAGLEASESVIYGRFGYGLAANLAEYVIDSRASAFAVPAPAIDLELVDRDEAAQGPARPSSNVSGGPGPARSTAARPTGPSSSPTPRTTGRALRPASTPCATRATCCTGPTREANVFQGERARIIVEELRGESPEVEAALWRFVLDLDLVGQVIVKRGPVDEPIRWRLADPRQLRTGSPSRTGSTSGSWTRRPPSRPAATRPRGGWSSTSCRRPSSEGDGRRRARPLGARGGARRRLVPPGPGRRGGRPPTRPPRPRLALHGRLPGLAPGRRGPDRGAGARQPGRGRRPARHPAGPEERDRVLTLTRRRAPGDR